MFDVLDRSWHLTKLSFAVIWEDKETLAFPLLAGVFSILYTIALVFPTAVGEAVLEDKGELVLGTLEYVVLFAVYAGLAFITTFFNVCVVYTTKTRFEGGDATFLESVAFAASRVHHIVAWSLVSATVGVVLHSVDRAGERAGPVGRIVLGIVVGLLGVAWSVITVFVVPAMVYEDVGPIEAIKSSVQSLRRTWGESLARHWGLGLIQGIAGFVGVLIALPLLLVAINGGPAAVITVLAVLGVYILLLQLVFTVANSVFSTALYVYATTGETPGGFDDHTLRDSFYARDRW